MGAIKPIPFNTDMVRALLDDRKTVTRRVVKPQPVCCGPNVTFDPHDNDFFLSAEKHWLRCRVCGHDPEYSREGSNISHHWIPPYRPGDILYVQETWCWCYCWDCGMDTEEGCCDETAEKFYNPQKAEWGCYGYKASFAENESAFDGWHPSIHMPRESARIFLRVTDVSVRRVQDITDEEARREGCTNREDFHRVWNDCYAKPRAVKGGNGTIDHYESYPWEDIRETRTYRGKPWYVIGNPWVWVIEFERIEKGV